MGLDAAELRKALEDGRYEPMLDQYRQVAESSGISAIPAHVFGRKYLVMGAQPIEVFRQVVGQLREA